MQNKHHQSYLLTKLLILILLPAAMLLMAAPAAAQTHEALLDIEDSGGNTIMQVYDDSGLLLTGERGTGVIPAEGRGVRLMWYPARAAFRAGGVSGTQWDDSNIGFYSVALGQNTTASGRNSTAMGEGTVASGSNSTAINWRTTASGINSTAMGAGTIAANYASLSVGKYNSENQDEADNVLFVVGNGTNVQDRSDALVLYENGNLWIAGTLTGSSDIRLKTDIKPLGKVLKRVLSIKPLRYRFKPNTGHPEDIQIGLSAQDVRKEFPILVEKNVKGYLSLSYTKFTAVLLKAVQEQQRLIDKQQTQINAQEANIKTLREHVQKLETQLQKNRRLLKRLKAEVLEK